MPPFLKFFCFILAVLPLSVLGHDAYIAYETGNPFSFSAFGWLLETYAPIFHQDLIITFGRETFKNDIIPILEFRAFPTLIGITALFYGAFVVLWILGLWPFNNTIAHTNMFSRYSHDQPHSKKMRYNRK